MTIKPGVDHQPAAAGRDARGGPWVALLEADLTDYAGMYVGGVPGSPTPCGQALADAGQEGRARS